MAKEKEDMQKEIAQKFRDYFKLTHNTSHKMKLVYLSEETPYDVDTFRKDVSASMGESSDAESGETNLDWLDEDFLARLKKSMDNGLADKDETTVVKKTNDGYSFRFVGLYDYVDNGEGGTGRNLTFFFMPKFVSESRLQDPSVRDAVLQAIDHYLRNRSQIDDQTEETEERKESLLERAVRLLRDYLENGVYTKHQRELECNEQGEIDRATTIDQYQSVFLKGQDGRKRPVYMDTATELANSDEDHYITRLHQCLVTTWGRKLEELGLSSVLRVNVPLLSEEELVHLGTREYQLEQIRKELGVQFVTKSRHTLFLMKELIERMSESLSTNDLSLSFGINGAEHLWEAACAAVLGSELDAKIGDCGLVWSQDITFRDYMPRPIWKRIGQGSSGSSDEKAYELENKQSGWRLDFIRTYPPKREPTTPVTKLVILDAKYYTVSWDKNNQTISGQPGIGDIAKQIFYQKAFEDLLRIKREDPAIDFVNAFLFPKDDGDSAEIALGETVHLGWTEPQRSAAAFSDVNLFTVYISGIKLLEKYANGIIEDDWFEKIANRH